MGTDAQSCLWYELWDPTPRAKFENKAGHDPYFAFSEESLEMGVDESSVEGVGLNRMCILAIRQKTVG